MIAYNPKDWFGFLLRIHRGETLRALFPLLLAVGAYSAAIAYFENTLFNEETRKAAASLGIVYSTLGFMISLMLVFRTNSAYDRWWEGRKLWGSLVNCTRNLALQSDLMIGAGAGSATLRARATELLKIFPSVLMHHLRDQRVDLPGLPSTGHQPLVTASELRSVLHQAAAPLPRPEASLLLLNHNLDEWMNICGACERIKNTPIPFIYSVFIKKFVFIYVMLFPWVQSGPLGYKVVPVTMLILYVLASLELIAEEIENPFNGDANDLPLEGLCSKISDSVSQVMGA